PGTLISSPSQHYGKYEGFFTPHPSATHLHLLMEKYSQATGDFSWKNPIIALSNERIPFEPQSSSTLHAPVTLSALGDKRDVLYKDNGRWLLRRNTKTENLTANSNWYYSSNDKRTGYRWVRNDGLSGLINSP